MGSSPRVRGTLLAFHSFIRSIGIIPACAGNTGNSRTNVFRLRDHPRVCGEHICRVMWVTVYPGSSPRVRGTLDRISSSSMEMGIIPACAGNTNGEVWRLVTSGDHPRVCGEHMVRASFFRSSGGSSPRVRGTPQQVPQAGAARGIIPACAGNTEGAS